MAASERTGTLQTATTENAVIDGEMYIVGDAPKPFITKIRANSQVHYTIKDVKGVQTLTFIREASASKAPAGGKVVHESTVKTMDEITKETDAYNAKGIADAAAGKSTPPKKEESFECGGCKRLIFKYPCVMCHFDPSKPVQSKIADTPKPPGAEKKPEAKKETQPAKTVTETQEEFDNKAADLVQALKYPNDELTSITLGVSLRFGAYNNIKIDVTGCSIIATTTAFNFLVDQQRDYIKRVILDIQREMGE